jgi:pyruvate/2-oxoglutarate dehydrogenase complex dihydrolipoamide acyltransferase (E2) component
MGGRLPALIVAPVPRKQRRTDPGPGGRIPFWAHQLAELLLGVVLLFEGARNGAHAGVMIAGIALMLFTLSTDGPLAAWPRLPRRVHRIGDFVFVALLALSPLLVGFDEVLTIVLLEGAAVVMLWLALRSEFRAPARRRKATSPAPAPDPTPEPAAPNPAPNPAARTAPVVPPVPSAREAGRALGKLRAGGVRAVGRAVGKASAERASEGAASAERASEGAASAEQAPPPRPDGPDREDESPPE